MAQKKSNTKKEEHFSPRQISFAMYYYLPNSKTYGNALQSALKAGFSPNYAKNITIFELKWLEDIIVEIIGKPTDKKNLVAKAKRVLDKSLDSDDAKLAQDTAKFISNTDKEFSSKQDITSNGESINSPVALVEFVDGQGENTDTN